MPVLSHRIMRIHNVYTLYITVKCTRSVFICVKTNKQNTKQKNASTPLMECLRSLNKKYLLVPKVLFFSIALLFYTMHTFKSVFAKQKFGVSDGAVGFGFGMLMFITFFSNIYFGSLNDKWGGSKTFLITFLCLSTIFFQLFFFTSFMTFIPGIFWINMLLYLGTNLCTTPLMDKIVLEYLSQIPNLGSKTYGTQRLWGTVGYAVCNYIIEFIVTDDKNKATRWHNLRVYNLLVAGIAVALCYYLINWDTTRRRQARNDIWTSFKELITNWDYMFFIFIILLNGLTRASMTIFITVYWKDILQMKPYEVSDKVPSILSGPLTIFNKNTASTANLFGIMFEILIFFKAQAIIEKIGYFWPLFIAQGAQMIRFVFYWWLPYDYDHAYAMVCMIELFKGLNFGLTHCSAVHLATKLCPPHLKATSQTLYQGTFTGLGSVLAGVICSFVFSGSTMKDENISIKERSAIFDNFFLVNILFTALTLVLFFYMYGIVENVLFNKENAQKKLEMYDEKVKEESKIQKNVDKNTITNK